jgi:hypothetical protein
MDVEFDWRSAANCAMAKAEGEMAKIAVGALAIAAAALEQTYTTEAVRAQTTIHQAIGDCAKIAAEIERRKREAEGWIDAGPISGLGSIDVSPERRQR